MSVHFSVRGFLDPPNLLAYAVLFGRAQWWDVARQRRYQDRRLREAIRHAATHVPYYREWFGRLGLRASDIRSVEDLGRLPILTKDALHGNFSRLEADDSRRFRPQLTYTSGTSGRRIAFLLDRATNAMEFAYYRRCWGWGGYRLGDRFAEFSAAYFLKRFPGGAAPPSVAERWTGRLLLNSLELSEATAPVLARAMRNHRARFMKGMPSVLYFFAYFLRKTGERTPPLRAVFCTGELLLAHQRSLIEEVFGCKAYDSYGHMERVIAISECPAGRMHVNSDYGITEFVDRKPVSNDPLGRRFTARLVGTSLHNRSMPLIRYDTGDLVEAEEDPPPCACGRRLPTVLSILGRKDDAVLTPEGRVVTTLFLVFQRARGVATGQIVQETRDRLTVRVAVDSSYDAACEGELVALIRRQVGPAMRVEVETVPESSFVSRTADKFKTVISRLERGPFVA